MARVYQSGFEVGDFSATSHEFSVLTGTITVETTTVRTGTYSMRCNSGANWLSSNTFTSLTEFYEGFYCQVSGDPSAAATIGWANTLDFVFKLNTDRTITIFNGVSQVGTSVGKISTTGWTLVEMHIKVSDTVGAFDLRIDGISEVTSGNINTGTTGVTKINIGPNAALGQTIYFDDWVLNDTTGSFNNSWPGAHGVVLIKPGSDTATIQWTALSAGTHFSEIDEIPGAAPDDATSYVVTTSKTQNLEDRWNMTDTPSAIASGDTINAIMFGVRGGGTGTTSRPATLRLRDASNNTADSTSMDWNVNGWKTFYPVPGAIKEQTWEASPAALTKTYLDGLVCAAIDTDTSTREIRWTAVWCNIDFTVVATFNPATIIPGLSQLGSGGFVGSIYV